MIIFTKRKHFLIEKLKYFNDLAEKEPINEQNIQEYGWIGIQINVLDNALKHIYAKFKLKEEKTSFNNKNLIIIYFIF